MTSTVPADAPAPAPGPEPTPVKARNAVGRVALGVALLTFLLAVIPPTSFIAWLPAVAAIILAIVGLTRKNQGKGASVAAIVIAPIAWIIAIVVALGTTVGAIDDAMKNTDSSSTTVEESVAPAENAAPSKEAAPAAAGIGTPVTSEEGVTYTVTGFTCGITTAGPQYFEETATGQFCEVKASMMNNGKDSFDMFTGNVKGLIDGNEYDPSTMASTFAGESFSKRVNPGLGIDMVLYFDVPADKTLQSIQFSESSFFSAPVSVDLK